MVVIDTTLLVDLERGRPESVALLDELRRMGEPVRIPAAVWVEFLYRASSAQRARAVRLFEQVAIFEPFTREHADEAIRIQHALHASGGGLGWHDLQVAATARVHDEILVTNDKAFARVDELRTLRHD